MQSFSSFMSDYLLHNDSAVILESQILSSYDNAKKYVIDNLDVDIDLDVDYEYGTYDYVQQEQILERIDEYVSIYTSKIETGVIEIYRGVRLDSISDLDLDDIGHHWSFVESGAGVYGGHHAKDGNFKDGSVFILTGLVSPEDIDWEYGFASYIYYGSDQTECALNTDVTVKITKVNDEVVDLVAHTQ